jgi:aminoglycoside phosphotransferase (APT) family kinase protein
MSDPTEVDDDLVDWVRDLVGGSSATAERRSAGASRAGYAVDVRHDDGRVDELWLRADTGVGPQSGTAYTVRREAAVYRALQPTAVLAPPFVGVHPTREAFVTRRLEGRNWFSELTDDTVRVRLATALMGQLVELHRLDVRALDLPELGAVGSVRDHMSDELDNWCSQYRRHPERSLVLELALRWLRTAMPAEPDHPPVLVQGDTGPGNFMFHEGRLVAVTDWELAHYGDPHEDLGWLFVRDLQERFTSLTDRLRDYTRLGGRPIDLARLRYSIVLAQAKCAIGTLNGLYFGDNRAEVANLLIYSTLHVRLLGEALAGAIGHEHLPAPAPEARDLPFGRLFDIALDDLATVVTPSLSDGFALKRAKGIARIMKFLRDDTACRDAAEAAELTDIAGLLGERAASLGEGRARLCDALGAGTLSTSAALEHSMRQADRATFIARRAMGALAQRGYSPIGDIGE